MKKLTTFFGLMLTLFSYTGTHAQCTLACYTDFNLSLDASGHATITAEDVLAFYGPACGTLVLEPSTFDCSDIGVPVPFTVTDLGSGNVCDGNIHVRYNVGAMSCYGDINVTLGPSGTLTLTPEMLLFDPAPACIPGAIISPPTVSCADIGTPVEVFITDPVSGNSCWTNVHVTYDVGAMSCYGDINVTLGPSGTLALTPEMILFDPAPACIPGAIISPSTVSCADIGSPVEVLITDPVSGNSCWSNVHVSYPVGAMSCYSDISVQLDPSGTLALTPEMVLFDPPGTCIPGAIISPSTVTCADIDLPVVVTITDPVSGNSCWSTVTVEDPRPTSCEIIVPDPIHCGDSGVPFSVNATGGYGLLDYYWEIKGNPHGWSILTGQGTDNITMAVGDNKIKLEVTLTDICGKKRKCSVKPECEEPPAFGSSEPTPFNPASQNESGDKLEIFPNPASHTLWVKYPTSISSDKSQMYIVDQLGRLQTKARIQQNHDGVNIDVEDLQEGVYWLILEQQGGEPQIQKFIKQ